MFRKIVLFFAFSLSLFAHQTSLSYLQLKQQDATLLAVEYKKPLKDALINDIHVIYPPSCTIKSSEEEMIENGYIIHNSLMFCEESALLDNRIWVEGMVQSDKGMLFLYENDSFKVEGLFRASTPFVLISQESHLLDVMVEYMLLGVEHILLGYDHLLFVFLLFLLARGRKELLFAITAFTLSHSLTLAVSIFEVVTLSEAYIESMIALSIMFLAREYLIVQTGSLTRRYLPLVALVFGLLHGFGFSSALTSVGLPQESIGFALFAFNVGIELGQIAFIALMYTLGVLFLRYKPEGCSQCIKLIVVFGGAMSAFWFIERTF